MAGSIDIGYLLSKLTQYPLRMLDVDRLRRRRKRIGGRDSVGSIGTAVRENTVHSDIVIEQDEVR
jgi:hypothetical protein